VNLWAQSQFRIKITDGTPATNAKVVTDDSPIFATLNDAELLGPVLQANLSTLDGEDQTDDDVVAKLQICSQLIAAWVEHPIAASTFLHEEIGFNHDGFPLLNTPVLGWDTPYVGTPGFVGNTIPLGGFDVRQDTGYVTFTSRGINPYVVRVMDMENMLKMTYVSGQDTLSSIIKHETLALTRYINVPRHIKSIRAADFNQTIDFDMVRESVVRNVNLALGRV